VTFDWLEGPEPVAFQVTGTCGDHAHFVLLGIDGQSVADGTLTRRDCLSLANLVTRTTEMIDRTDDYTSNGIAELESLSG
jgi:hypothetical protein